MSQRNGRNASNNGHHRFQFFHQQLCMYLLTILFVAGCQAWLPDTTSKLYIKEDKNRIKFAGNVTVPDHFTILYSDDRTLLVGARNTVYNLSLDDLKERTEKRITWPSTAAHRELCYLKGKTEEDCQNYIRILFSLTPDVLQICGTNSYKPLCRQYTMRNGKYVKEQELEGKGICPYDPKHNSTAIFSNGQLFTATVADFQGIDPLVYREPQRTERLDLKQLNAPNFISSIADRDFIYFFYRETAVEYINCGKVVYSRVARICKNDKGGPHQFRDRWTSFLKARLNCSVPGEFPFYFDEIQGMTSIVDGQYGSRSDRLIYGTLTTPNNAIGGSAICAYSMDDIMEVFRGSFKDQESINSNWLPIPERKVPDPRPGQCVQDSRTLKDATVNFVKSHSLMEGAVPSYFGQPILMRVSLQYRFTAIAVEPQVKSGDQYYDILYVGTDDGRVLKVVNIPSYSGNSSKAVVISETSVLPLGIPVKEIRVVDDGDGQVVVVSDNEVQLVQLLYCGNASNCVDCLALQDPHCGWDMKTLRCAKNDGRSSIVQDVNRSNGKQCPNGHQKVVAQSQSPSTIIENEIRIVQEVSPLETNAEDNSIPQTDANCAENVGCAVRERLVIYTAETLHIVVIGACIGGLGLGFIAGYLFSRRFQSQPTYQDAPFIEQHNHLDRRGSPPAFLTPRANKAINLVVNMPSPTTAKKDNLVGNATKDLNITNEGTLQKIKKTYI